MLPPTTSIGSTPARTTPARLASARRCAGETTSTARSETARPPAAPHLSQCSSSAAGSCKQVTLTHVCSTRVRFAAGARTSGDNSAPSHRSTRRRLTTSSGSPTRPTSPPATTTPASYSAIRPFGAGAATSRASSANRRTSRFPYRSSAWPASCLPWRSRWCRRACWTPDPATRPSTANTPDKDNNPPARHSRLQITGRGGVPTNAAAATINVTTVDAGAPGFVTVYPCDAPRPLASSLNYTTGTTIPNELISKLSTTGTICIYTHAATDLIIDTTGWLPTTPSYTPLVPARLLDTRPGNDRPSTANTPDKDNNPPARHSRSKSPDAAASPPTQQPRPSTSPPSTPAHQASSRSTPATHPDHSPPASTTPPAPPSPTNSSPNSPPPAPSASTPTPPPTSSSTPPDGSPPRPATHRWCRRACWTPDPATTTIDGQYAGQGQQPAGSTLETPNHRTRRRPHQRSSRRPSTSPPSTPAHQASSRSTPATHPDPLASSLNYTTGTTIPNELISKLSTTGTICIYTHAATDLIIDTTGWLK